MSDLMAQEGTQKSASVLVEPGPYKTGDLVVEDHPWIYTLRREECQQNCHFCLRPLVRFVRFGPVQQDSQPAMKNNQCSGCKVARYCSKECQKMDWNGQHKFECSGLRRIGERKSQDHSDPVFLMMFKVVAKLSNPSTDKRDFLGPKEGERTFWDLSGNVEDIKMNYKLMEDIMKIRGIIAGDLKFSAEKMTELLPLEEFVGVFARIKCNAYHISGDSMQWIASAIYINASVVQHSCKPNAVRLFDGKRVLIRTISEVESFSQLRISLVDELQPRRYRRKKLTEIYHIICRCEACSDPKKDAEMFALKCVNPNCDAKIPSDERADQPCPTCGQKGEDRQKDFKDAANIGSI